MTMKPISDARMARAVKRNERYARDEAWDHANWVRGAVIFLLLIIATDLLEGKENAILVVILGVSVCGAVTVWRMVRDICAAMMDGLASWRESSSWWQANRDFFK